MKLWLIVAYLLFVKQEYNRNSKAELQKHGGHVVDVIEHTDHFQKFGKPWRENRNLKKSKKSDFLFFKS